MYTLKVLPLTIVGAKPLTYYAESRVAVYLALARIVWAIIRTYDRVGKTRQVDMEDETSVLWFQTADMTEAVPVFQLSIDDSPAEADMSPSAT